MPREPVLDPPPRHRFPAPGVFVEEVANALPRISARPTGVAGFVGAFPQGPIDQQIMVTDPVQLTATFVGAESPTTASRAAMSFFANGGESAWVVRTDASPAGIVGDPVAGTGLHALAADTGIDVVCVPDTAAMAAEDAATVVVAAIRFASERRCFVIVDPPSILGPAGAVSWVGSHPDLRHPNAAAYLPELIDDDGPLPASGAVAGVYARTDRSRGVWKAPAGLEAGLRDVTGLTVSLDASTLQHLIDGGLNPLRTVGDAHVIWGARTLTGQLGSGSDWIYVPVRRTALFLEREIETGTRWAVFEPNAEPLWATLRTTVTNFLDEMFRRGAFQGTKPDHGYFVRCDRSTITQGDLDAGTAVMLVGFAPLRPAEFVILQFRIETATTGPPTPTVVPLDAVLRSAAAGRSGGDDRPLGIVVGGPGPQRVRSARRIAGEAGRGLLRIDLSRVSSKFIGETEKNLRRILTLAHRRDRVVFFDEADALFGKRTQAADAAARFDAIAGILDRHPGIVVFGANDPTGLTPRLVTWVRFLTAPHNDP